MNFGGIIVGAAVFLSIGICHPAVIKMEYYWGKRSWWIWLVVGLICTGASLFVHDSIASTILGGFAFSCFWAIHEMFLQEKRVLKGGFRRTLHDAVIMRKCEIITSFPKISLAI